MDLTILHALALIGSAWRVTEALSQDNLPPLVWLRNRVPSILWSCVRCLSVWGGAFAVLTYAYFPWGNWPLALSWLYLWRKESLFPYLTIRPTPAGPALQSNLPQQDAMTLLNQVVMQVMAQQSRSAVPATEALVKESTDATR